MNDIFHDGVMKLIKNQHNAQSYAEPFDMERLEQIADLAKKGIYPNGSYSDLECHVHSLMTDLIEYGKEKEHRNRKDAVNELCLKCGQYKTEHLGSCDGCRWRELRK